MDKVLVTGAAGMIGSHLIDLLLEKNIKVFGLDTLEVGKFKNLPVHKNFRLIEGSVLDQTLVENLIDKVDAIVHLATLKKSNNQQESRSTLRMITKSADILMEKAWRTHKRFILASTSDVYGYGTSFPFVESDPVSFGPFNTRRWAYATAKQYTEQLAFDYAMDGLDVRIIRYFGGFSERSATSWQGGHVPIFVNKILNKEEIDIHGDGKQTRCVTYGADLAYGTYLTLIKDNISGELFNIGGDEEISVKDTAIKIAEIAEIDDIKLNFIETTDLFGTYKEINRRLPSLAKSKLILGYQPKWTFEDGIKKMINHLNLNK
jgi:UDP-glucose 4-epimerase